ncbi:MAG: transcription antitermination factor NusB [Nitratireductor sp.]
MANKTLSKSAQLMAARLAAVQALYDIEMTGHGPRDVVASFTARGGTAELEGEEISADAQLFADIVNGVAAEKASLDALVAEAGRTKRPIDRYEALLRAILRAGALELQRHLHFDAPLLISQYLSITDSFYERTEVGLVNGVLDSLAKQLRPAGDRPQGALPDPLADPLADPPESPADDERG